MASLVDDSSQQPKHPCLDYEFTSTKWHCFTPLFIFNLQRMAAEVYHQAIGSFQSHSYLNNYNYHQKLRNNLVRLVPKGFISSNGLSRSGSNHSGHRNCSAIRSSASQTAVVDPVSSPSRSNTSDTQRKSSKTNSAVN